jgi:parallel beta-helix repeat protein
VEATARDVTIQGNFIGTSAHNLTNGGNGTDGVFVQGLATNVIIGGTAAGTGNVISGNKGNGIHLKNVTQTVQITGNWIGTTVQGTGAIGNAGDGVFLEASGNARIQSNTISGNGQNGVELVNGSNGNTVTGNEIGVGADGTTPLGNLGFGVWAHQGGGAASSNNTIGTTASRGLGNVIGFNAEGVVIGDNLTDSSQQDAIEGNSIFGSPILIDLGNLGVPYKPSGTSGPNFLQVIPTLTSATVSDSDLTIKGLLNGTLPNTTYRIEFFAAQPTSQPFRKFLGFINVTTDSNGNVPGGFSDTLKGVGVKDVEVSATATDQNGNTTGFARAITTAPLSSPQSPTPTQSPTPPQSPTSSPPPSSSAPRLSPSQEVVDMALETAAFLLQDNLPALLNLEAFSRFYLGESLPPSSELLSSILSDLSEFGSAAFLGLQLGLDIAGSMHGTTK